ncbi:zinc-binding dehydrogenase [Phycisphaerales bacterium AB-hyl4]|uniref:Zinc-binding dehydrogenase n=1 Tax=Natronomicrosphaera hydrolytica TaxID=3242702 RepID=A0ABV4U3T9_9BACT
MKSIGLYGKKDMVVERREVDIAEPGFNDAVVKVHACGVCGTDMNFLKQWSDDAMPLGHEIAAEVVAVGDGVSHVQPGDHVIVEDCAMCGLCDKCKGGRPDLCVSFYDLGGQSGMGQYMRVRCNNLVKYEGLSPVAACLTEPLAVSLSSVLQADVPLGGSVLVIGCGPLGLMSAKVAKLQGAGFVAATQINTNSTLGKARTALAEKMGIDQVIDAAQEDVEAVIKQRFPDGVDRVIVSAPPESMHDALKAIAYGGIITFYGLHFGDRSRIEIDINHLIFRKITLRPVFAEPAINFSVSLDLLKRGLIPAKDLVTHQVAPAEAEKVFHAIADRTEPIIKAVVLPIGMNVG